MDILEHMDRLLASAESDGRPGEHWVMPEENWAALDARVANGDVPDASLFDGKSYRGLPVRFGNDGIVGLMSGGVMSAGQ